MIFLANVEFTNFWQTFIKLTPFFLYIYLLTTNNIEQYVILIVVKFFMSLYFLQEYICKAKKMMNYKLYLVILLNNFDFVQLSFVT